MTNIIIIIFIIGYLCITIENITKVNKSAVALFMGVVCWALYMMGNPGTSVEDVFLPHVGETCETILFLMGAMAIVEIVDSNGGFNFVTRYLHTTSARILLWEIIGITFILSALLDNMTTSIVMVMVLKKLVADKKQRLIYAGMIVLAANSGGAFSPIGDVTTIMLWIKGCVSTTGIIGNLFLPSIASVIIPAFIISQKLKGEVEIAKATNYKEDKMTHMEQSFLPRTIRLAIFFIGVGGLTLVPVFRSITGLPPFAGIMALLSVLWIFTEIVIRRNKRLLNLDTKVRVSNILHKLDLSTILFFLGILFAVGALTETGTLAQVGDWLNKTFHGNAYAVNGIIGILSSIVDNVPLVASAMGMYSIEPDCTTGIMANFIQDGNFWNLLAYCAGTGGSILIIGSAAGVIVMGLEQVSFTWYLRNISWLAFIGYISGIIVYWLLNSPLSDFIHIQTADTLLYDLFPYLAAH
ncbi:MAG: sodium:proton antiporter NhaD [Bacteroidaceae bacterium]|nr:sodium:proton antiporter NhaD [Bacteroidaceae bacterium]